MSTILYVGWLNPATAETHMPTWHREPFHIFRPATLEARQTPGEYPIATQTQYTFQEQDELDNIMEVFNRLQNTSAPHDVLHFFSANDDASLLPIVLKNVETFNEDFGHFQLVNEENGAKICFDGRYKNIDVVDTNYDRLLGHICLVGNLNFDYTGNIYKLIESAETYEKARLDAGAHTFYNFPVNMLFMPAYQKSNVYTHEPINWWYSAPTGEWMGGVNNDIRNLASTWQWRQFITGERHIDNPPRLLLAGGEKAVEIGLPFTKVGENYLYDSTYETENPTPVGTTIKTNTLRYYSLGTDIKSLFSEDPSNVEEVIYLENGWISRQLSAGNLYYRFGYGENFLEWKMLRDDAYGSTTKYELYLIANESFAKIDADKWIDHVPDDYIPGDFETSPFLLYRYGGAIHPQYAKVNFFDYDTYPGAVWPVMATNLVAGSYGDFFELCTLTNYSNATKETWKGLLVGFEGKGTNWGDGSIGGGFAHTAGGKGDFDDTSDSIGLPELTDIVSSSSFIFLCKISEHPDIGINRFGKWLTSDDIFGSDRRKDAMNAILYLKKISLPGTINGDVGYPFPAGKRSTDSLANFPYSWKLPKFNYEFTIGHFEIEPYFDNFLDYKAKYQLYLPYVGIVNLEPSTVVGHQVEIKARVDLMSCTIMYFLIVKAENFESVLSSYSANIGTDIPLTSTDYSQKYDAIKGSLVSAGTIVTGLATANPLLTATGIAGAVSQGEKFFVGSNGAAISVSGTSFLGNLSPRQCYLIITRQPWNVPENYAHQYGLPSNITAKMSDLKGFTKIASIHLDGFPGTKEEKERLMAKLQKGVVIR